MLSPGIQIRQYKMIYQRSHFHTVGSAIDFLTSYLLFPTTPNCHRLRHFHLQKWRLPSLKTLLESWSQSGIPIWLSAMDQSDADIYKCQQQDCSLQGLQYRTTLQYPRRYSNSMAPESQLYSNRLLQFRSHMQDLNVLHIPSPKMSQTHVPTRRTLHLHRYPWSRRQRYLFLHQLRPEFPWIMHGDLGEL